MRGDGRRIDERSGRPDDEPACRRMGPALLEAMALSAAWLVVSALFREPGIVPSSPIPHGPSTACSGGVGAPKPAWARDWSGTEPKTAICAGRGDGAVGRHHAFVL